MTLYLVLAVLFGVGAIGLLLRERQLQDRRQTWVDEIRSAIVEAKPGDRAALFLDLRRLQNESLPWYDRTLSAVGVLALVSMTVAAAVQTVRAVSQESRLETVQAEVAALDEQRTATEDLIAAVSSAVLDDVEVAVVPGGPKWEILRYRLRHLRARESLEPDENRELYRLAMVLRDFPLALSVLEVAPELREGSSPLDRITLAEYFYLTGADGAAERMAREASEAGRLLPSSAQVRLYAVRAALGRTSIDALSSDLARQSGMTVSRANDALVTAVGRLRDGRRGSLGSASDRP